MVAASGAVRRRRVAAGGGAADNAGMLRFYTDDAPGLKIGPTTVLIMSLLFIGSVVMLHIWAKLSR